MGRLTGRLTGERRWKGPGRLEARERPRRSVLVALVLASLTLVTLDARGGSDSPVEPVRRAVGEAFGPVENATAAFVRPFTAVPSYFRSRGDLREEIGRLETENAALRRQVDSADLDRNRLAELEGLTRTARSTGYTLVPANVVALGPAQSFSQTVTIDAGTSSGVHADMTVLNNDGLVGRVVRATRTTATVVLVIDAESVVGGRLGSSMEIGVLHGRGSGSRSPLDLELVDEAVVAEPGDVVSTFGSDGGAPYVSGIPIGKVTAVFSSPRETSRRAEVEPLVDFTSLDLVGVVVPGGAGTGKGVIKADGSHR
jgi:rod shape-determining protein MreC